MTTLENLLGPTLKSQHGKAEVATSTLADAPVVALYFSAHWCPPCKMFTGKLRQFYNAVNAESKRLEIVWISGDEDEEEYDDYFEEMPWIAMPFEGPNGEEDRENVSEHFDIASIPQLLVLNKDLTVKTAAGKADVETKGVDAIQAWL